MAHGGGAAKSLSPIDYFDKLAGSTNYWENAIKNIISLYNSTNKWDKNGHKSIFCCTKSFLFVCFQKYAQFVTFYVQLDFFFKFDPSDMSGAITRIDNAQIAALIPFWKQKNMSTIPI